MNNQAFSKIWIVVAVAVFATVGILAWQYLEIPKEKVEIPEIKTPKEEVKDKTADWRTYTNKKYGYSFKYPPNCFYGPWPAYCEVELKIKQKPLEELPQECLCYLNTENLDSVFLKNLNGPGPNFEVFHSIYVDYYSPPAGTNIVKWIKENFSYYQDVPDEINMEIDGIPAVKIYTPYSGMAGSYEDIYFIKNGKLFRIGMLDIDNEDNKERYNQMLSTFRFIEIPPKEEELQKPYIKVLSPNGGEKWMEGSTYKIKWDEKELAGTIVDTMICLIGLDENNSSISARKDWRSAGCSYIIASEGKVSYLITDKISIEQGIYNWTIPHNLSDRFENPPVFYKVGIVVLAGPAGTDWSGPSEWGGCITKDESDDYFSIIIEDETADWKTYRNEYYGFELTFPERWKEYKIKEERGGVEFKLQHSKDKEYHQVFNIMVFPKKIWEQSQSEENSNLGTYIAEKGNNVFSYLLWKTEGDKGYIGFPEIIVNEIYQGPFFDVQTKIVPTFKLIDLGVCEYRKGEYEMRIYDSQGRITGLVNGEIKQEIPNSIYDSENENVIILDPENFYVYEIFCIKEGNYQFGKFSIQGAEVVTFNAINIPISPGETHRYKLDWDVLLREEDGATLLIDADGDGVFEKSINSDITLTCQEFITIMGAE